MIGTIAIKDIDKKNNKCNFGYYISPHKTGRGYSKQIEPLFYSLVFDEMGFNRLECEVFEGNIIIRIHEKYGMKQEGFLRQYVKKNGEFINVVAMALLKEDWDKIKMNTIYGC